MMECLFIFKIFYLFFVVSSNKAYPIKVDNKDPANTPILTPSMYSIFSTKNQFQQVFQHHKNSSNWHYLAFEQFLV